MVQRTKKQCSIDGCETPGRLRRGWCPRHYWRWWKYGDPIEPPRDFSDPEEAFAARTRREGSCVIWTGALSDGYGNITINRKQYYVHRLAWEKAYGAIPEGMTVDHICFNRKCVNVAHLRLLTRRQNTQHLLTSSSPNTSGYRGVWWDESRKAYSAMVRSLGVTYFLGRFNDPKEAGIAAAQKRRELGFPDSPDDIALLGETPTQ